MADVLGETPCAAAELAEARAPASSRLGRVGQGDNRGQHQRRRASRQAPAGPEAALPERPHGADRCGQAGCETTEVRIGLALPQYRIDVAAGTAVWRALSAAAAQAERLGLDSVWLSDHPFAIGPDGVASGALDPFVCAAALARATRRIEIGTLVASASMRAPGLVAHLFASLAAMAPRRIVSGLGAGWYAEEHRAFGVPLRPYGERVAALGRVVERLGDGGDRPELLVGGAGPELLTLAATRADGWNVAWDVTPERFAALNGRLDETCARAGRDPSSLARSVGLTVAVATTERGLDDAVARLRERAPFLSSVDRAALAGRIVVGTPAVCIDKIAAYRADGCVVALLLRDDAEMLECFASEVAPSLRG